MKYTNPAVKLSEGRAKLLVRADSLQYYFYLVEEQEITKIERRTNQGVGVPVHRLPDCRNSRYFCKITFCTPKLTSCVKAIYRFTKSDILRL